MKKRKLQATGGSSLTLTLPKSWTSRWKLEGKDAVLVNVSGSSLVIKPTGKSKTEITFDISIENMANEWIVRELIGAYVAGADKVIISSTRIAPEQNDTVRQASQLLFGFEILEESSKKIVLRNILDNNKFPVSESTLRMFATVRRMFQDALKAAQAGDKELAIDIKQRDYEVNKQLHAIERQFQEILRGKIEGDLNEVNFYCSIAAQLERIGDHAVKIAELASEDRTETAQLSGTFPVIKDRAYDLLKEVESMVRNLDKSKAHKILDINKELENLIYSSKRMKQSYEGAIIEDSADRLRGYLMNIAELTIDYSFSSSK